jgi:hypothetical protein
MARAAARWPPPAGTWSTRIFVDVAMGILPAAWPRAASCGCPWMKHEAGEEAVINDFEGLSLR